MLNSKHINSKQIITRLYYLINSIQK